MKAYYKQWEISIIDFIEDYNSQNIPCIYVKCYVQELDAVERFLLSDIDIR